MSKLLCFDVGTSGIKCGLFSSELNGLRFTRREYKLDYYSDGRVEADPEAYFDAIVDCTKEIVQSGIRPEDICAICVTTQGETLIPVDKNGNTLSRAIVWLDNRAAEEAAGLRELFPDEIFRNKTGLPRIDGYTPLAKLEYIRRKMPEVWAHTRKFMLLEDYIVFRLTGKMISEKSLLCSTGYFDLTTDCLWKEALDAVGADQDQIPKVVNPGDKIGNITKEAAMLLSLTEQTEVYAGAMDQVAGAIGCGNIEYGNLHEMTGTAMVVGATLSLRECLSRDQSLTIYRHAEKGKYLLLSISRSATSILKWFAEQFYSDYSGSKLYEHLSECVSKSPVGANGLMMLPVFEGTEQEESMKGLFWNVGLYNTREDFVRAVFEGVAFMLKENIRNLTDRETMPKELISIGGASKSEVWSQIKADVTGCQILTMTDYEAALSGCACLASVGNGTFDSLSDAVKKLSSYKKHIPAEDKQEIYAELYEKYQNMQKNMVRLYKEKKI